jgi:hypothetical protein
MRILRAPAAPYQFSFQMIADLFRIPKTTAWEIHGRFEHAEHEASLSKFGTIPSRPPDSLRLPEEDRRVIAWIGDCQRQGNCPSPCEVCDFGPVLFQVRTGQERFSSRDWRRGFCRQHEEEFAVNTATAKQAQHAAVTSKSVLDYFDKLKEVLLHCLIPAQILNMDETGLSVDPLKGKKQKFAFLKTCCVTPSFHEERSVNHVSLAATVTLDGQALTLLLPTTSIISLKAKSW